ncbi:MAG: YkgJ family cysteine cluster protein [Lentisphaeraceae bacterium]|nr:YkgJ family cysteine cluster protein [Lentisphaeraceae bacterium]
MHELPPEGQKWLCQRCGNCCRWPGLVRVSGKEIDNIAAYLKMTADDFLEEYVDITPDRQGLTIIEGKNGACVFMEEPSACKINPVKPTQCGGFPNTWNFEGWQKECEAELVDKDKFDDLAKVRDIAFDKKHNK